MKNPMVKKLKTSENYFKPENQWKNKAKDILISQLSGQSEKPAGFKPSLFFSFKSIQTSILKFAIIIIIIAVIGFGWTFGVDAARNSLPGDILYPVKLTSEQISLGLTFKQEEKASKEIEYAKRRIDEVTKITDTDKDSQPDKVKQPLEQYQKNIKNASLRIENLDLDKEGNKEALAELVTTLVTTLEDGSQEVLELLKEENMKIFNNEVKDEIKQALSNSQHAKEVVVNIIVKNHQEGETLLSEEEIKNKIEERLSKIEAELKSAAEENTDNTDEADSAAEENTDNTDEADSAAEENTDNTDEADSVDDDDLETRDAPEDRADEMIEEIVDELSQQTAADNPQIKEIKELIAREKYIEAYQKIEALEKSLIEEDLNNEENRVETTEQEDAQAQESEPAESAGGESDEQAEQQDEGQAEPENQDNQQEENNQ